MNESEKRQSDIRVAKAARDVFRGQEHEQGARMMRGLFAFALSKIVRGEKPPDSGEPTVAPKLFPRGVGRG